MRFLLIIQESYNDVLVYTCRCGHAAAAAPDPGRGQAERSGDCNGVAIGGYHASPRIERGSNVIPPWRQVGPQCADAGVGREGVRRIGRQLVQLVSQVAQVGIKH